MEESIPLDPKLVRPNGATEDPSRDELPLKTFDARAISTTQPEAVPSEKIRRDARGNYDEWRVGDLDPRNEEIKNICGQRESFVVYFVKGGWLNWFYDAEKVKGAHRLEAGAQILLNRGKSWIRQKKEFGEFRNVVAAAMVHGLSDLEDQKGFDGCFKDAESFLNIRSKATYQITFVISALLSAFIFGGLLFFLATYDGLAFNELHRHLHLGGASGAYGALLSMLIRAKKLEPEIYSYDSRQYVMLESSLRIMLGISFGFLLVLLQKAGLLLHIADKNVYFVALGSIVAGFNERLVPALLSDMEGMYGLARERQQAPVPDTKA